MDWNEMSGFWIASGRQHVYLVDVDEVLGVRLTRWLARPNQAATEVARQAARNLIVFPMGRGPGRPAGEPELAGMAAMARDYAERYERGDSLPGYAAWFQLSVRPGEKVRLWEPEEDPLRDVRRHFHDEGAAVECRKSHEPGWLTALDPLADLRVADQHVPDWNRAEADRRLAVRKAKRSTRWPYKPEGDVLAALHIIETEGLGTEHQSAAAMFAYLDRLQHGEDDKR